ncbi:hypothetical protein TCAL_07960 [Tigriopus californicus]|uniref:Uncharacterized protein n=1 Tax=Tigriopus californicus TaxID=6832 RepID=A0A553NBI1_TIGCA|nr:hypothetical protein TCAL_07960 [Tigriopus californicus]
MSDDLDFSDLEEYSDDSDLECMEHEEFDDDKEIGSGAWKKAKTASTSSTGSLASAAKKKITENKHIEDMKAMLGLEAYQQKQITRRERKRRAKDRAKARKAQATPNVIQTLATRLKSSVSAPEIVAYEDPRRKRQRAKAAAAAAAAAVEGLPRSQSTVALPPDPDTNTGEELSMKQARFEVFRFGLRGLDKASRESAQVSELIRLGAKPPKRPCVNYSELKVQRQAEKEEALHMKTLEKISGVKTSGRRPGGQGKGQKRKTSQTAGVKKNSNNKAGKAGGVKGKGFRESIQAKMGKPPHVGKTG